MEARPIVAEGVGAIEEQHVQVDVEVEGGAETLDQGDRAGSSAAGYLKAGVVDQEGVILEN